MLWLLRTPVLAVRGYPGKHSVLVWSLSFPLLPGKALCKSHRSTFYRGFFLNISSVLCMFRLGLWIIIPLKHFKIQYIICDIFLLKTFLRKQGTQ